MGRGQGQGVKMNVVTKVVNELKKVKEVQGIYLFGSQARKKAKPLSDIDIAVITKNLPNGKKPEITLAGPQIFDISLFWDLPIAIRYRVLKEGQVLLERDKLFLHRVRVDTLKDYLDFKPIIDRHVWRTLHV